MKLAQDSPSAAEMQQPSQESQGNQQNNGSNEPHVAVPNSISAANNDNRKVSREDIELVQNLIERCLQLYMNKGEVVRTLSNRARIEPSFTTLVWQKLEEENSEFFRAYYIRLKLKKQILMFNHLLEHQYHMMKYPIPLKVPLTPMQNGIHPMPVNNLPMGYPVIHQPQLPTPAQPHRDSVGCGPSSCHLVNGIPAPAGFQPIRMNSSKETFEAAPATVPCVAASTATDMAVSPSSAASSNHFPFTTPSEIAGLGMDSTALDPAFTSNVEAAEGLTDDGVVGLSRDSIRSLGQLWNFSLSDLTVDLASLGDLGSLGEYTGSPFLPSDSDILLDSPEQDDIVEEYFADAIENGPCSQSDDEKS